MKKMIFAVLLFLFSLTSYAPSRYIQEEETKSSVQQYVEDTYLTDLPNLYGKDLRKLPIKLPFTADSVLISSDYGFRTHPILLKLLFHNGIDFALKENTIVNASGDGIVEKIEYKKYGYGNNIVINHGNGYKTRYAHLLEINVIEGQEVNSLMPIGKVGETGLCTGPHLHFEVILKGTVINPKSILNAKTKADYIEKSQRVTKLLNEISYL